MAFLLLDGLRCGRRAGGYQANGFDGLAAISMGTALAVMALRDNGAA